jgi:ATP-dependent Zn protease
LLQAVVAPLLPRAAEIPYSEFKMNLVAGQVTDVTLGTPSPIAAFILSRVLPLVAMMGLWSLAGRSLAAHTGGGMLGGGMFGVGKSKATEVQPEEVGVTFKDVGGADEAITELREIIELSASSSNGPRLSLPRIVTRSASFRPSC